MSEKSHPASQEEGPDTADSQAVCTEEAKHASDEIPNIMAGLSLVMTTMGMMTVVFLVALDHYILAQAIPRITTQFNSLDAAAWYSSGYFLTNMVMQPAFSQIYTYFSVKRVYLMSVIIFELGSLICAVAPSSIVLIIGRLITGVGGGGLYVGTVVLIGYAVPVHRRPFFISVVTSLDGAASVAGPLLGGVFTDSYLTWRFCFWINLPIGFAAFVLIAMFCHDPARRAEPKLSLVSKFIKIDYVSLLLLLAGFIMLLLALQWASAVYAWTDSRVLGCLTGSVAALTVYLCYQYKLGEKAAIPYRILLQRTVLSSSIFMLLMAMLIGVCTYYLPFYFQAGLGTSAESSGVLNLPYLATMMFSPLISGTIISWLGYYVPFMYLGSTLAAVGSGLLITLTITTSQPDYIVYQFLVGLGAGISHQIPYTAIQFSLPNEAMVQGSALASFLNSLGSVLGIVGAQAIFDSVLVGRLSDVASIDEKAVYRAGPTNIITAVPSSLVAAVRNAYIVALQKTFFLPTVLGCLCCICCLGMEWKRLKVAG